MKLFSRDSGISDGVLDPAWERTLLLGRVRRLERTNRIILSAATLLIVVMVCGARLPNADRLDVQQLTVRDKQGVERATIGVDDGGTARFDLSDPNGRRCLGLAVDAHGAVGIDFLDSQGADRLYLGVMPDGRVALTMFDKEGGKPGKDGQLKGSFGAGIEPDGTVGLSVLGRDGRNLRMMSRPGHEAAFSAFSTELEHYASLGFMPDGGMSLKLDKALGFISTADGEGYLSFHDGAGLPRMEIGAGPKKGAEGIYIRNTKTEARAVFEVGPEGVPRFILYDKDGNTGMELPPRPIGAPANE